MARGGYTYYCLLDNIKAPTKRPLYTYLSTIYLPFPLGVITLATYDDASVYTRMATDHRANTQ